VSSTTFCVFCIVNNTNKNLTKPLIFVMIHTYSVKPRSSTKPRGVNMHWKDVLARTDLVGGDIKCHKGQSIFRGPIERIRLRNGFIHITTKWMAEMPVIHQGGSKKWKLSNPEHSSLIINPKKARLQNVQQNRVLYFTLPGVLYVIFPKGESKLDPTEVEGLEV